MEGKKRGLAMQYFLSLVNVLSVMRIVLYVYDVPRLDSAVAFNVLTKYIMLRLNSQIL